MQRSLPASIRSIAIALATTLIPAAGAAAPLFHPLVADPRQDQIRVQIVSFTQDYRYGTDVTDSTSVAGVEEGRRGTSFEIDVGRTFRGPSMERLFGWRGPWERWQLGIPAGIFTSFQRIDAQLVNTVDYQFGMALDVRWRGDPERDGDDGTVVATRTVVYHRSSHIGDEYVTLSRFGRNQEGIDESVLSGRPPIKRVEVSYEALRTTGSVEWARAGGSPATLRLYGGGEFKVSISRREPHRMGAPSAQAGVELHSDGRRAPARAPWLEPIGRLFGEERLGAGWFAAADLRLARPFDFASCDNPDGTGEAWTPRLYSTCPYGCEGEYAGSWHGMVGARVARAARAPAEGGTGAGDSAVLLSLDWYRGYSPFGPFQDQRFRYHPRWYFVPSVTFQLW